MKWLIVFKKENHSKAMSLLETLGCSVLNTSIGLDKNDSVVSVEGPDNLVQLADQLTKLVESSKDIIEIWCDSKISLTSYVPKQCGFGANNPSFLQTEMTGDATNETLDVKYSYPDQSQTEQLDTKVFNK